MNDALPVDQFLELSTESFAFGCSFDDTSDRDEAGASSLMCNPMTETKGGRARGHER
jgi:hypothetical protein